MLLKLVEGVKPNTADIFRHPFTGVLAPNDTTHLWLLDIAYRLHFAVRQDRTQFHMTMIMVVECSLR